MRAFLIWALTGLAPAFAQSQHKWAVVLHGGAGVIERKTMDLANARVPESKNTLKTRTLTRLPGEVFV